MFIYMYMSSGLPCTQQWNFISVPHLPWDLSYLHLLSGGLLRYTMLKSRRPRCKFTAPKLGRGQAFDEWRGQFSNGLGLPDFMGDGARDLFLFLRLRFLGGWLALYS